MQRFIDPANAVKWDCPLNRGLVSRWMCLPDQQRGLYWRDLCGRNHGTLTNMDPATDWVSARGRPGGFGAIDFDGSNDRVAIALPTRSNASPFTFCAWIRPTSVSSRMSVMSNDSDVQLVNFEIGNGTGTATASMNTASFWAYTTNNAISANTWNHVTWVLGSASTADRWIYVNGVDLTTYRESFGATTNNYTGISLGSRNGGASQFFSGKMDDVRVWSRVVSASEVLAICQDSRTGSPRSLNWIRRRVMVQGASAPAGNRRRRVICGAAA